MERALQFERVLNEFFLLSKHHLRSTHKPNVCEGFGASTNART